MVQLSIRARQALSSAAALLSAQWIMALVSIPSSNDYETQLAAGTSAEKITTIYDNLSLLINVTLVWSWLATYRFMLEVFDREVKENASAIRLKRGWVIWGWVVPIVSFWFPKRVTEDLVKAKVSRLKEVDPIGKTSGTWWATWVSFILLNNLISFNVITGQASHIQPSYEIAAACMLTASYMVWTKIIKFLA
jgi:hypothetical protein